MRVQLVMTMTRGLQVPLHASFTLCVRNDGLGLLEGLLKLALLLLILVLSELVRGDLLMLLPLLLFSLRRARRGVNPGRARTRFGVHHFRTFHAFSRACRCATSIAASSSYLASAPRASPQRPSWRFTWARRT